MNKEFLSGYAFEQMAREYNKKYSSGAQVLSIKKDEKLKSKIENILDEVFHLFYLIKNNYGVEGRFKGIMLQIDGAEMELHNWFKETFNEDYADKQYEKERLNHRKFIDNYFGALEDMLRLFVDSPKSLILSNSESQDLLFAYLTLLEIFSKSTEVLKKFYLIV